MEFLITIGDKVVEVPDTISNLLVVTLILLVLAIVVNIKIKNARPDDVPSTFLLVVETYVEAINNLVKSTMGEQNLGFGPYIFSVMTFLLVSNLLGLIGLTPPTSDFSVTFSLALVTFVLTQFWAFRNGGGILGYLKGFTEPMVLLTPLNVIGEIANPISLSFRLFGNIMSGGIIMALIYQFVGKFAVIVAPPLHLYFDVFSGILQAFIFTMLTMIFVGGRES